MVSRGILLILDGWGHTFQGEHNAIHRAATPAFDRLAARHPLTLLQAAGRAVGLGGNTPGNSEVGHMTLGSGRVIDYESTRVERAIESGALQRHPVLQEFLQRCRTRGGRLHLVGLASDGNIHAHLDHFRPLVEAARTAELTDVFLHLFTDGRDSASGTAVRFVGQLADMLERVGSGEIASVIGRDFGMDRNGKWHKTQAAYELMVAGQGTPVRQAIDAVTMAYSQGSADDLIPASVVVDASGAPVGTVQHGDLVLAVNFRGDRMRQIMQAFQVGSPAAFDRSHQPQVELLTLTAYHMPEQVASIFEHVEVTNTLGDVLEERGIRNLRVSESEKYPHVTFFFDGRVEKERRYTDAIHVPGPQVNSYRQTPGMNAQGIVVAVNAALAQRQHDLMVINLVNADILGHTGDMAAVQKAVETVDWALGEIVAAATAAGYWVAICGDHGNAEVMFDVATGMPHVGHTTNLVPFLLVHSAVRSALRSGGGLADVAPTLLHLLDIPVPAAMTGTSLVASGSPLVAGN